MLVMLNAMESEGGDELMFVWTNLTSSIGRSCSEGERVWMMLDFESQVSVRLMVEAEVAFKMSPHLGSVSRVGDRAIALSMSD